MTPRCLWLATFAVFLTQEGVCCVAEGPLDTARWIHTHQREFAFRSAGADVKPRQAFLSPTLYTLLASEWVCQNVSEGLCALDADPWTNDQVADVGTVLFKLTASTPAEASVQMYHGGETRTATLKLVHDVASGCWLLDDLVGERGISLRRTLQRI